MRTEKATEYVGKKVKVLYMEPNITYGKYKECTHVSLIDRLIVFNVRIIYLSGYDFYFDSALELGL
jgi:hypothetical protein